MNYPKAIGPYSAFREAGDLVFCSGQIPLDPETGEIVGTSAAEQAEQALKNVKGVLEAAGLGTKNVVKTLVFLSDINDFGAVNEVYAKHFGEPFPARSAVGVAALPKGAKVEIEVIAHKKA